MPMTETDKLPGLQHNPSVTPLPLERITYRTSLQLNTFREGGDPALMVFSRSQMLFVGPCAFPVTAGSAPLTSAAS